MDWAISHAFRASKVVDSLPESIHAFKISRASGPGQGKSVLICIMGFSLGFHAISLERSSKSSQCSTEPLGIDLFALGGRKHANRQTDRHTNRSSI